MTGATEIRTERIASEADLILLAGTSTSQTKLLVSSTILSNASPTFKALLGPNFREGQVTRSPQSPQIIELPEDHPRGLAIMCKLLHGVDAEELHGVVATQDVLRLAIAADKYAVTVKQSLYLSAQGLFHTALDAPLDDSLVEDLSRVIGAAYLFNHKRCFEIGTKRLIEESLQPLCSGLSVIELSDFVPGTVAGVIEMKRMHVQHTVAFDVPQMSSFDEEVTADVSGYYPWPCGVDGNTPLEQMDLLDSLREKGAADSYEVEVVKESIRDICQGLCLRCVREGRNLNKGCTVEEH